MLKLVLVQTWAQMGSCQGAGPAVAVLLGMPSCRGNSAAQLVPSLPVAGKTMPLLSLITPSPPFHFFFRLT